MKNSILVIGGNGFIGRHLSMRAVEEGYQTTVVSLNLPDKNKRLNNVSYIRCDITKYDSLFESLNGISFEYVVNLSGYISHDRFKDGGSNVIEAHFVGVINLIKLCSSKNIRKFVQIGTSDEYGDNLAPQKEKLNSRPKTIYSLAKSFASQLLQHLYQIESFPAVIFRLFLVYGPGQTNNRLIPQVINGCLLNKNFPVSEGTQIRDFCYVEDVVDAIFLSLKNDEVNGEIINLGSGNPISIRNIINLIQKKIGSGSPQFGAIKVRESENNELYPDIKKSKKLLRWKCRVNLDEGLNKTIAYYRKLQSN